MESRRLGATGPEVSLVGLGCNNFGMKLDEQETREVVHAALDAGITHFDTAEGYGGGQSEVFLGKALGDRRNQVVVPRSSLHVRARSPTGLGCCGSASSKGARSASDGWERIT